VKNNHREGPYDIGYGKPPLRTRFQKGQSGNSRGRPTGAKNFTTMAEESLRETVMINEEGRRRKATKMEVIFKQICNKAVQGDHRSARYVLDFIERHLSGSDGANEKHFNILDLLKAFDRTEHESKRQGSLEAGATGK